MQEKNVYDRARNVVRELVPVLHEVREHDKSLADQLKRAAQSVVLNIEVGAATRLDERLDEVCAITWCLGRRL